MVDKQFICVVIIAWGGMACTMPTTSTTQILKPSREPSSSSSLEKPMISDKTIRETTQRELSKHLVGVSNIWERELPDDQGVIARRMAAQLTIYNIASEESRVEDVFAGRVISVGTDRYYVVDVEYSQSSYGSVILRKIESKKKTK